MLTFLLRSLRARAHSLALTILGLAIAFAATLASLNLHAVLRGGHPQGTQFSGTPVSIFSHISARDMDIFLFPRQILALQEELGDSGTIVASSGSRIVAVEVDGIVRDVPVDVAAPGFFTALGVIIKGGDPRLFGDERADPACVLSEHFMARMGLQSAPRTIQIAGRSLRVIGIARGFNGLWDHETEVWVDWRLGHDLISPTTKVNGLDGFYWALALPTRGQEASFHAKLERALARRDLTEPPFDSFRVVPGITNQADKRRAAESSSWLYLVLCAVMLTVASVNLAAWSALMRAGKIENEWTFLRLGIPRLTHALLGMGFVMLPVLAGALLALPLERLLTMLLRQDSSIYSLLAWSANFERHYPWGVWLTIVLAVIAIGWLLGLVVTHQAGLRFSAPSLRSTPSKLERLFRPMSVLVALLAAVSLLFGMLQSAAAMRTWKVLAGQDTGQVWALFIQPESGSPGSTLDGLKREAIERGVRAQLPHTQTMGFVKIRPLSSARVALSTYTLEPGGPPALKLLLNEADAPGMQVLGANLRNGRPFDSNLNAMEMVLDERAAQALAQVAGRRSVLNMNLYDELSMPWRIVGVVDRITYGPDPDKEPPVAYVSLGESPLIVNLVLRGPSTRTQIDGLAGAGVRVQGGTVDFGDPVNLAEVADKVLAQYKSRALLSMIAAVITIAIAALTILSITTLEVRRRRRLLAVRASLGERPWATAWHGVHGVLLAILLGTLLGMVVMWLAGAWLGALGVVKLNDYSWGMPLSIMLLVTLGCVGSAFVLWQEFFTQPLARHLREE